MSFQYRAMQLYITNQCFVFKNPCPQSALSHLFLSFVRFFLFHYLGEWALSVVK